MVQSGDSIARIADQYGVSQRDLREMNNMKQSRPLRVGEKLRIPNVLRVSGKPYEVQQGDTLSGIASRFNRPVGDIVEANKISATTPLRVGRTIIIPDEDTMDAAIRSAAGDIRPIRFLRIRNGERQRIRLYQSNGIVSRKGVQQLSHLARDLSNDRVNRLNYELIKILQLIALEFPDKPIEIVSGYRTQADGNESQHMFGRAMDFRIPGVPPRQIYNFCRKLPRTGCGFYPNQGFVHVDAREKSSWWVNHTSQ